MINERSIGIVDNLGAYCFHILGCGAIGSSAATQLARMGAEEIVLYDFDKVEIENVGVSQYYQSDIGKYNEIGHVPVQKQLYEASRKKYKNLLQG